MLTKKIILDTDIGDDIDDAFALALLTQIAGAEVIGVTTVFRNTFNRAQQATHFLKTIGKDIPVYAGERLAIKEQIHPFPAESERPGLENESPCQWDKQYEAYSVNDGAVDFIIESAEKYGDQLVIMPVGPLTNIARAIKKAPESMKKVGKIVQMGGWFSNYVPEWNILCDPDAADIVWSSGIPVYAVGLDVTLQCALDEKLMQDFRDSQKTHNKIIVGWLDKWFDFFHFEKSVMHDPLAVACHFEDICTFEKKWVKVNLTDKRGAVMCTDKKDGYPINVATNVDKDKFYSFIRRVLL